MSFLDDLGKYGSSALESVGETFDVFAKSYAKTKGEEEAANPDTHAQLDTAREPDGSLAQHQQQGFLPMASNNTLLIAGGVILLLGVGFALMRKG